MNLTEWAQFAQAASVLFASLVALYGIDAWRREHVGKRNIELAEDVLAKFYQARDVIVAMRSPLGFGGEGETRKALAGETPEQKAALDQAFVLIERYRQHSELFGLLHALRYRFMASFGEEKAKPFADLTRLINELIVAAHTKARIDTAPNWGIRGEAAEAERHAESERVDRIFYATGTETDPIEPRVNALVTNIEMTCRAVIQGKSTLFGLLNFRVSR